MKIFAMKPGHDGAVALVDAAAGKLEWSFEPEKDSFPRYEVFNPSQFVFAAEQLGAIPDVFAVSGWGKGSMAANAPIGAGYYGHDSAFVQNHRTTMFGANVDYFTSSHERSHIWCAYGLSPFEQGKPCYVLTWEGALGDFYLVDEKLEVHHIGRVMMTSAAYFRRMRAELRLEHDVAQQRSVRGRFCPALHERYRFGDRHRSGRNARVHREGQA